MNEVIVLFEPNCLKFFSNQNNQITKLFEFPLIFYFNENTRKTYNSSNYRFYLIEKNKNFFNDIYTKILSNQSFTVLDNRINCFDLILNAFDEISKNNQVEKFLLTFTDNFEPTHKTFFNTELSKKYKVEIIDDIAKLAVKAYIVSNNLTTNQTLYILSSFDDKIIGSEFDYSTPDITLHNVVIKSNIAYEPFFFELAKNICESIYRIYNIADRSNFDSNVLYVYYRTMLQKDSFKDKSKRSYVISTKLIDSSTRYIVRVNIDEVEVMAKNFTKNTIFAINQAFKLPSTFKYIYLGDFFGNELIYNEIKSIIKTVHLLSYSDVLKHIKSQLPTVANEDATMFMTQAQTETKSVHEQQNSAQVEKIIIGNLQIGDRIKLSNFDQKPGKGWAYQHFEYIGDNRFIVIDSTRSLKPGDIIETKDEFWTSKTQIFLDVYRSGKFYGKFQTREIQKIELIK